MITVVDKGNDLIVQKITGTDHKLIRYQVIPADKIGDYEAVKPAHSLVAARAMIGKTQGGKPIAAA